MRRCLILLLVLCVWSVLVSGARAHAVLLDTSPVTGTVLQSLPKQLNLTFSEIASPMAFRLVLPNGTTFDLSKPAAAGIALAVEMPSPEPSDSGTYFVEWHVMSEDGHPIAGSVALTVGRQTETVAEPILADPLVRPALWLATTLAFAGAFFGVGGSAFAAFLPNPEHAARGRWIELPLLVSAVGIVFSLPLHGIDATGAPIAGLLGPDAWIACFATSYASQAIGMGAAILLSLVATRTRNAAGPALALIGLVVLCTAMVASGHVATASPRWIAISALVAHVAGFCFWIGALPTLVVSMRGPSARRISVLTTFSRLILYSVVLVIASGITLAAIQLGPDMTAWTNAYGFVLIAKLSLLVLLFGIALWNRLVLTGPVLAGDAAAARRLRALVVAEVVVVLGIVGVAGLWRFTPPPRVLAQPARIEAQATERSKTHLHASSIMADFEIVLGDDGATALVELHPESPEADIRSVRIRLTPPADGAVPLALEAIRTSEFSWKGDAPFLGPGRWLVQVEVRTGEFDLVKMKGSLGIS
jgi:copper transport protein